MKIVFLAPPGQKRYVRDYYCSKVAKAGYSYAPVDLLMMSGRFQDAVFIDAIAEQLTPDACLDRIEKENPDAVITLAASVSWPEDHAFLARLKQRLPKTRILATGDVLLEGGETILARESWLDGIILDFTNADALNFLTQNHDALEQMIYRTADGRIVTQSGSRRAGRIEYMPMPRHDLFLTKSYAYPFVRRRKFATVQTDYGCPFSCRFCVMGSLGHKWRANDEIVAELLDLKNKGVREIYFNDQTFGGTAGRLEKLCRAFVDADLKMGWCCWNRVDVVKNHLELMKQAGCHTIMFGVDATDDETLRRFRKGYTLDQVYDTFQKCRELGLRTLGTFVLGLPGQDRESVRRVLDLALEIDPDFVSFNVFVPRKGTEVRGDLEEPFDDEVRLDQTGDTVSVSHCMVEPGELKAMRDGAVRGFYMRPKYIWRRLAGVRTWYDLTVLFKMGTSMIW
jgi:anaerobic magnesium-protoporphyrin IX monomethyl ester cyclase